ncbi:MAG: glutamate synthase subunit alpha, partial [Rhizobiales bacterium]|nr:glutamate synthase subunit alpha [Hyphomicrobiales bacterium]
FATAALVSAGCVMMRKCHLNTCPVGIATQDPVLRKRFKGAPEHVINYFFFLAEEVRELMAEIGVRTFAELVGMTEWLDKVDAIDHWKAGGVDFSAIFEKPENDDNLPIHHAETQQHQIVDILDRKLIEAASASLNNGATTEIDVAIGNTDRTAGAMLSGEIAKKYGHNGLPDDTITVRLTGVAGQSFGAFVAAGLTMQLTGEANDYVGKGLSGGKLIIKPSPDAKFDADKASIVGNTVLYGAIGGECYFSGCAGERFAVRNSGAVAVVEGVGDHGCEYMTGGVVLVIGRTGRNFAAGMSGGVAYVLDEDGDFSKHCNLAMVDLAPVPSEEDTIEELHHHGGDFEHHGLVDITADMTRHDADRIWEMLGRHLQHTGSERARKIINGWDKYLPRFVKVMPVEYRRALLELERAQSESDGMQIGMARSA